MGFANNIWNTPCNYLVSAQPEDPVLFFAPSQLEAGAKDFLSGFPGMVTYAVKANPMEEVIVLISCSGITAFDVASPFEMRLIRRLAPNAVLHYNNPVRSLAEIAVAVDLGVRSYSVDSTSELAKLVAHVPPAGTEISVRFKLPVRGAAYNFGAKFGASAAQAVELLKEVEKAGFVPSLTFHVGTQCTDPAAWGAYIWKAAEIATQAGVKIARLNVGGGFPSHRLNATAPDLPAIFAEIDRATHAAFGAIRPFLVCEPGRALCADAFAVAARVKALRDGGHVFLNDGVYGALTEFAQIGATDRRVVLSPLGFPRAGKPTDRVVFGPTCDSLDKIAESMALPDDLQEGDYVLFYGTGAYSTVTNTRFNGFGNLGIETVLALSA
jgi:ornithine decarboxylase